MAPFLSPFSTMAFMELGLPVQALPMVVLFTGLPRDEPVLGASQPG